MVNPFPQPSPRPALDDSAEKPEPYYLDDADDGESTLTDDPGPTGHGDLCYSDADEGL